MQNNPIARIVTFYSFKGGVGRTMGLANAAWMLASNGMRVLIVDWDFDAPSLHRYFRPFLKDPELNSTNGLIDLLIDFMGEALTPEANPARDWYFALADVNRYAAEIGWSFPSGGKLALLAAGRQGSGYVERVSSLDWDAFYGHFGGGVFLEAIKTKMRAEYDYILIDSRTGVSDTPGICTVQMPDDLVVCFTLNSRAIGGAVAVASSVFEQRLKLPHGPLRIFPVPMRVETAEAELQIRALDEARESFRHLTQHIQDQNAYWGTVSVPYIPYYSFNENLAAFVEDSTPYGLLGCSERLVTYLTDGRACQLDPIPEDQWLSVLKLYKG
jgi:MinD-like ATPase involved in chromosome partitioning or flagellar assembly